jgi:hypothetical protein
VNTKQSDDLLLWKDPKGRFRFAGVPRFTPDGRWLVLDVYQNTDPESTLFAAALGDKSFKEPLEFRQLSEEFEDAYMCKSHNGCLSAFTFPCR